MKRRVALVMCFIVLLLFAVSAFVLIPLIQKQLYPRDYCDFVSRYSAEYSVPEPLVYAVIHTESGFDPDAVSHAGATGLMQLMPDTLDWLSRLLDEDEPTGEINDPETNIKYGTYYLRHLYDRFGSWETAVAAYNAGHGRVTGWLEDSRYTDDGKTLKEIPIEETSNYVNKVFRTLEQYENIYYGDD